MIKRNNPHVVPIEKGKQWAVRIENNEKATSVHNTQS